MQLSLTPFHKINSSEKNKDDSEVLSDGNSCVDNLGEERWTTLRDFVINIMY